MKIETIEIAGLAGAFTALRLPFGKEVRSTITGKTDSYIPRITQQEKEHTLLFGMVVWT